MSSEILESLFLEEGFTLVPARVTLPISHWIVPKAIMWLDKY